MKKILSVFLCAVLIAMLLCGCGGSSKTESAPHMDAAKAGGSSASYAANGSVGWTMDEAAEAPMAMEPKTESQTGSSLPATSSSSTAPTSIWRARSSTRRWTA